MRPWKSYAMKKHLSAGNFQTKDPNVKVNDALEASKAARSCLRSHEGSRLESEISPASTEENDNHLQYPKALDIEKNDQKHFQWHLHKDEPIIVPNVLNRTTVLSWEPLVMSMLAANLERLATLHIHDFKALNSLNWCERRRSDSNNCHQCHRNDKQAVVRCNKCSLKYCIPCIAKWYTRVEETDFAEVCVVCRNISNCVACLKSDAANKDLLMPDLKRFSTQRIL